MREKLTEEELRKMHKEDSKAVTGIFRNLESPGGALKFSFRKYKYDPTETYTFEDGKKYTVPKMVAKHINSNCYYDRQKWLLDAQGNPYQGIDKKVKRYSFESLEFSEDA